jgi:hypothetical protein
MRARAVTWDLVPAFGERGVEHVVENILIMCIFAALAGGIVSAGTAAAGAKIAARRKHS